MHFRLRIWFNLDIRKLYFDFCVLIVGPLMNFWGLEGDLELETRRSTSLRCLPSLPFRADGIGIDILVIEVL